MVVGRSRPTMEKHLCAKVPAADAGTFARVIPGTGIDTRCSVS
jgi:hypothetical protein